ncbi:MAG: sulfite exporter TauE/SafE family protein [Kiloniellales bacterium]
MSYYLLVFFAGFAGSFHCIGMCGGFACALGSDSRGRVASVARHLLYNSGRVTTYIFLGVLAGSLTGSLVGAQGHEGATVVTGGPLDAGQRVLAVVAGLLMIVMALQFFGLLQRVHGGLVGFGSSTLIGALRSLLSARGSAAPLALGVVNGFLPCPLVFAFVAQAASTASAPTGAATMVAFGLGTFPAMLMMGGVGRMLRPVWRRRGIRFAGCFILLLGLITVGRGLLPLHEHGTSLAEHEQHPAAHEMHR